MKMSGKIGFGVVGLATMLAFAVNAALPSGYTELQFIQGTGDAQAYICASNIYINPQTDRIETTFEVGSSGADGHSIWCARTDWQTRAYSLLWGVGYFTNKLMFQASYSSASGTYDGRGSDPAVLNTKVTVTAEGNSWNVETANGISMSRTWPATLDTSFTKTGGPLFLFAAANGATVSSLFFSPHKLYSFKIYTRSGDEYTLSHDLVPAKRDSDGSVGLYDAAAGIFYQNNGSGSFIAPGTYYKIAAGDDYGESSLSGTSSASGWAASSNSTTVAVRGITQLYSTYCFWTNVWVRTPHIQPSEVAFSFASPISSQIVVNPGVAATFSVKSTSKFGNSIALNNCTIGAGGAVNFVLNQGGEGNYVYEFIIGGSFRLDEGATLAFDSYGYPGTALWGSPTLSAAVVGTGKIRGTLQNSYTSLVTAAKENPRITGDISGFTGDLEVYRKDFAYPAELALELVNANSIPADPPAGATSYVVVTNGATLIVDHDWTSGANRTWILGDGRRPTINVSAGATLTIKGELVGTAGFIKRGLGTLVLAGSVSGFSGDCEVFSGKVVLENGAAKLARQCFRVKNRIFIPSDYRGLDWIRLSGGGVNSYVDTGYTPTTGAFGFLLDYCVNKEIQQGVGANSRVMGSSASKVWGGGIMHGIVTSDISSSSGQLGFGGNYNIAAASLGGLLGFARMRLSLFCGEAELNRGWRHSYGTPSSLGYCGSIYIGTLHTETLAAGAPMDVYRFKVFEGSTLVHDFVPVKRTSDGAVGLYDTFGGLGFRGAAGAQYIAAGPAYSGSDSDWLEIERGSGSVYYLR